MMKSAEVMGETYGIYKLWEKVMKENLTWGVVSFGDCYSFLG